MDPALNLVTSTAQTAQATVMQKVQSEHSRSLAAIQQLLSSMSINPQSQEALSEDDKDSAVASQIFGIPRKPKFGAYWDLMACCWIIIGLIQVYQMSPKKREIMKEGSPSDSKLIRPASWKIRYQAAPWLTSRGFTILRTRCFGDWQYHFRPHRLRPLDAPIFAACKEGRCEDVDRMLSNGEASPFGWTPLHVSY